MTEEKTLSVITDMSKNISEQFGLPIGESKEIVESFKSVALQFKSAQDELEGFGNPETMDKTLYKEAKRIRNVFVKIRTGGKDIHKRIKANVLTRSKAIDKAKNSFEEKIVESELKMKAFETDYEQIEIKKIEKMVEERKEKLRELKYEDADIIDLQSMSEANWQNFLEKKVEERKELDRLDKIAKEKARKEAEELEIKRKEAEADKKKMEAENARLKLESDAKDKKLADAEDSRKKAEKKLEDQKKADQLKEKEKEALEKAEKEKENNLRKAKIYKDFLEKNGAVQKDFETGKLLRKVEGRTVKLYALIDSIEII